jgi:hypothetical protein
VRLSVVEIDGKTVVFEEYAPANRFTRLDAATSEFLASIRTP